MTPIPNTEGFKGDTQVVCDLLKRISEQLTGITQILEAEREYPMAETNVNTTPVDKTCLTCEHCHIRSNTGIEWFGYCFKQYMTRSNEFCGICEHWTDVP